MRSIPKPESGFSLLEMICCVALIGILALIVTPDFNALVLSVYSTHVRQDLESDISRARSEAVSEGARGVISVAPDFKSYTVGLDYTPFNDPGAPDVTLFTRNFPRSISMSASQTIIFDSRGYLIDSDGDLASTTIDLRAEGSSFANGTIYPTGALEYVS